MSESGRSDEGEVAHLHERPGNVDTPGPEPGPALPLVVAATASRERSGWRSFEHDYIGRVRWEFYHPVPQNFLERKTQRFDMALNCAAAGRPSSPPGAGTPGCSISHDPAAPRPLRGGRTVDRIALPAHCLVVQLEPAPSRPGASRDGPGVYAGRSVLRLLDDGADAV